MKTIKNSKELTTLELGDKVVFGNLKYHVHCRIGYFLNNSSLDKNDQIFSILNISKKDFVKNLGIETLPIDWNFPEVKSLEALTAIVSALFKEYEKQDKLPKTWKEFCKRNPLRDEERYITSRSGIEKTYDKEERNEIYDKNICTSEQEAKSFLALMQLRQLRREYTKDYEPNWMDKPDPKYAISVSSNKLSVCTLYNKSRNLSFPTHELANQFLNNFKDLLEIAKPLL